MPKDNSDFTVKPPENGALKIFPYWVTPHNPKSKIIPPYTSELPPLVGKLFKQPESTPQWQLENTQLSFVLLDIQRAYHVRVLMCASPERLLEDTRVSMQLRGATVEEALNNLGVLGLVWRKAGDVDYVAWNEKDLPPVAPAIVPAPQ